ncbi:MAG: alanine--tRNA ligase, partial [Candidatus Omnitrophica bacterium]|nr:alanine--tRNA ligase [Candidatus Omnitrophota bacterium]
MKSLKQKHHDNKKLAEEMARLAFELHDTYGYPYESTEASAKKLDLTIDKKAFEKLMQQQKERSRAASSMGGDVFKQEEIKMDLKPTKFIGYEKIKDQAIILKIFDENNKEVKSTNGLAKVKIVLDKTPFYPESGGQIGDTGAISKGHDAKIEVSDTKKINEVILHVASVKKGEFKIDDQVLAEVDKERRLSIARNHTATHLLQAALRKVLGEHVQQQGSLVAEDRLRFDFTHFKQLSKDELDRVEELVNEFIMNNDLIKIEEKSTAEAKKEGALAFFAEKYADKSRIISVGDYSKELCGGTHLTTSTGQIGLFKIIGESSIAQGIRRIEATTGKFAYRLVKQGEGKIQELSRTLKTDESNLLDKIAKLINSAKATERSLSNIKMESIKSSLDKIISNAKEINGVKIVSEKVDDVDLGSLRSIVDMLKKEIKSGVICLGTISEDKAQIIIGVTEDLTKKGFVASDLIKDIASIVGGTGGGRPDLAQAGGASAEKLSEALNKIYELVKGKKK